MVPAFGFALKSKNPGVGKSPPPASPAWRLGAGLIPARGLKIVTSATLSPSKPDLAFFFSQYWRIASAALVRLSAGSQVLSLGGYPSHLM